MQEAEQHRADGREPGPAVTEQYFPEFFQAFEFHHLAGGQIAHNEYGNDDFVGRESQDEGQEDETVNANGVTERLQPIGQMADDAYVSYVDIAEYPGNRAGGGGHDDGAL